MKKLIKISEHYYIVDSDIIDVIATTNLNMSIPYILNANDNMVNKEIETEYNSKLDTVRIKVVTKETSNDET